MGSSKASINLRISTQMSESAEDGVVRFSKKARVNLGHQNGVISIGKGEFAVSLRVKSAYKTDIQKLAALVRKGKVGEQEVLITGFVTRSTYQRVISKSGEDTWISPLNASIMVGCDPEFGLVEPESKTLRQARYVLPNSKTHPFGADGPGTEVRPDPSRCHGTVVGNMANIFKNPPAAAEPYAWIGGATYTDTSRTYWFGGHVHLGRPELEGMKSPLATYQQLTNVLDHLVALPIVKFDSPSPHLRRDGCPYGYGKAGDLRTKANNSRFEYRVLSGLWAVHPTLAKIVMGVTKAVAEDFYRGYIESSNPTKNYIGGFEALSRYAVADHNRVTSILNRARHNGYTYALHEAWKEKLRSLENYEEYKEEIEALVSLVEEDRENVLKGLSLDLKENWVKGRQLITRMGARLRKALSAVESK